MPADQRGKAGVKDRKCTIFPWIVVGWAFRLQTYLSFLLLLLPFLRLQRVLVDLPVAFPVLSYVAGQPHGRAHRSFVSYALSRDPEPGAMVRAGTDHRQAGGEIHAMAE